jgi:putative hydrolase of the HAD superfamily
MSGGLLEGVRAVFFDVTGTLLHPIDVAGAYARVGGKYGSRLSVAAVVRRFREAFRAEEERDAAAGWRTSEAREEERWRRIVGYTLADAADPDACFRELFAHFARPAAWRLDDDAPAVWARLRAAIDVVGLATNFDQRLHTVLAGFPELADPAFVVLSSEVGWRKPGGKFFAELVALTELRPGQILVVGDDRDNDYDGARAAGQPAVLFDPRDRHPDVPQRIRRLIDLLEGGIS